MVNFRGNVPETGYLKECRAQVNLASTACVVNGKLVYSTVLAILIGVTFPNRFNKT